MAAMVIREEVGEFAGFEFRVLVLSNGEKVMVKEDFEKMMTLLEKDAKDNSCYNQSV